jgi:hypothetical protein
MMVGLLPFKLILFMAYSTTMSVAQTVFIATDDTMINE